MVVLADEVLESFFETDLSASFRLEAVPEMELPPSSSGLLGDIWSNIATTDNKKIFNKFTDEIGKTIGKHQVCIRFWFSLSLILRRICYHYRSSIVPPLVATPNSRSPKPESPFSHPPCGTRLLNQVSEPLRAPQVYKYPLHPTNPRRRSVLRHPIRRHRLLRPSSPHYRW